MKSIIFFAAILLAFTKCHPKECQFAEYDFEIPASLSPMQDTFSIGDTITITSSFSDKVYDHSTDRDYNLVDFRFFPGTEIKKIDENPAINAVDDFSILIDSTVGYSIVDYSGEKFLQGEYKYEQNKYFLKFQLVAKEKGLFYLEQTVDLSFTNQEFEGKCPEKNTGVGSRVNMNDGSENNINMLKASPDSHYREWFFGNPKERFYKFGGYCFYVK